MFYLGQPLDIPFTVLSSTGGNYAGAAPTVKVIQADLTCLPAANAAALVSGAASTWGIHLNGAEVASKLVTIEWSGAGIITGSKSVAIETEIDSLSGIEVTIVSPIAANGRQLTLKQGDDYLAADGRALEFSSASWPDLTGAAIRFDIGDDFTTAGEVSGETALQIELTSAQTAALKSNSQPFEIEATLANGHVVTLVRGTAMIQRNLQP